MPKIDLVKVIVRYKSSFTNNHRFVYGKVTRKDEPRYLLLQRAEDDNKENLGKWECAGGKVEKGETSLRALEREIKEELGWEKGDYEVTKKLPTIRNCDVYLIDAVSDNVKISSEHSDFRWIKAEEIQKQDLVAYADLLLEFFNNPEKYLD